MAREVGLPPEEVLPHVQLPPKPDLGEYALPCFPLAKVLGRPPHQLASKLACRFKPDEEVLAAEAAGPYLNFRVDRKALAGYILREVYE
ncbi:MAG: arginine--tRNA ligase, partial [Candidatus Latescibacterota bacterium]